MVLYQAKKAWQCARASSMQREARLSVGRRFDDGLDLLLSTSALNARGQDHFFDFGAAGVSGMARGMDGERDREFFVRLSRGAWSFDAANGSYRKDDPTASYFGDPLVRGQSQSDRYSVVQLQYQGGRPEDALQFHARLFAGQEHYLGRFNYGTPFVFPVTSDWRGAEWRVLYGGWEAHRLMLGVELQDNPRVEQRGF
jgi:iron complex outermembrane receptor protein